jgi:hypothetical protein
MATGLVIVDTKDVLTKRELTFSSFSRGFYFFDDVSFRKSQEKSRKG